MDIGDSGVGGALLVPKVDKKSVTSTSVIKFSTHQELPWQDEVNLKRFLNDTASALKQVISDLLKASTSQGLARPREVLCFLSAPFYASQSRVVKHISPDQFLVSAEMVDGLIKNDLETFAKNYPNLHSSIVNDHQRVIESKIMQFKLNRYPTHKPYGKEARELEIHNYVSIGSEKILSRLEEKIT